VPLRPKERSRISLLSRERYPERCNFSRKKRREGTVQLFLWPRSKREKGHEHGTKRAVPDGQKKVPILRPFCIELKKERGKKGHRGRSAAVP